MKLFIHLEYNMKINSPLSLSHIDIKRYTAVT